MAKVVYLEGNQDNQVSQDTPSKKSGAKVVYIDQNTDLKSQPQLRVKSEGLQDSSGPADSHGGTTSNEQVFNAFAGRLIPSGLAMAGQQFGGPLGGAAGTAVGEALRKGAPSLFGGPDSGDVTSDAIGNVAIPGALEGLNKFIAGPKQYIANKLASTLGQKLPAVKNLIQADSQIAPAFDNAARDAQLRGFSAPEPNLDQVKQTIQQAQESNAKEGIKNPIVRYARNSIVFRLGAMAGLGGLSPVAAGAGTTLILGNAAIKQLTKDPEIASLLIKAIKTPGDSEQAGLIGKTLMQAIKGSAATLVTSDGEKQPAQIDDKGNLTYPRQ